MCELCALNREEYHTEFEWLGMAWLKLILKLLSAGSTVL
jgi:hypothetical protein